jgi:hypothetical protein
MGIINIMARINKFPQNILEKLKRLIGVLHKTIYAEKGKRGEKEKR